MSNQSITMLNLTPTTTVGELLVQLVQGSMKTGHSKAEFDIHGQVNDHDIVANFQITLRPKAVN